MEQEPREQTELERSAAAVWPLKWHQSATNWPMVSAEHQGLVVHVQRYSLVDRYYWQCEVMIFAGESIYASNSHPDAESAIRAAHGGWRRWAEGVPGLVREKEDFQTRVQEQLQLLIDMVQQNQRQRAERAEHASEAAMADNAALIQVLRDVLPLLPGGTPQDLPADTYAALQHLDTVLASNDRPGARLLGRLNKVEADLDQLAAAAESYISGPDAQGWERLTQAIDRARGRAVGSEAANGQ